MSVPRRKDELALWAAVVAGESPRAAGQRLGIRPGRVEYLCLKWATKGIYDYGVVHDLGWVVPWGQVQPIEPTEAWEQREPEIRRAIVAGHVAQAKLAAMAAANVDPDSAQVSIHAETVGYVDPETGVQYPPMVALRVQFTPTLDSRYPTYDEQEAMVNA